MKEEKEDFVDAGFVYFAEWLPIDNIVLEDPLNPETILIEKDTLQKLPKKCRTLVEIVLSLPEAMFMLNGKARKRALRRYVNAKTGWSVERMNRIQNRLRDSLQQSA